MSESTSQLFPKHALEHVTIDDRRAKQAFAFSQLHLPDAQLWRGCPPQFVTEPALANAYFWFPHGLPVLPTTSLFSSRLSQKLEDCGSWFDALRTFAIQQTKEPTLFLSGPGMATTKYLERICTLFAVPWLQLELAPARTPASWFESTRNTNRRGYCFLPPQLSKMGADYLIGQLAKRALFLKVSHGGNVAKVLEHRLQSPLHSPGSSRLLVDSGLTPKKRISDWLDRGVSGWWLYREWDPNESTTSSSASLFQHTLSVRSIENYDSVCWDDYLIHCTRRRIGAWPDQTDSQYLDDLIFQTQRGNHAPLAALCRILATRRIFGNNQLTRDSRPVVSFADIRLDQLENHHVFRPHLSRWDFEPFGIAIRKTWLAELGAQPVVYGDEQTWSKLEPELQPYFQVATTQSKSAPNIDWTQEREWRLLDELNLEQVPRDAAFVFVSQNCETRWLSELSNWPIVHLNF